MANSHFIFRFDSEKTQYLTSSGVGQNIWSESKADVLLMSEAEASDNCNEFSVDGFVAGCGSL